MTTPTRGRVALPLRPAEPTARSAAAAELVRDDAAWDAFVAASPTPTHLQLSAWSRVKAGTGWHPLRVVVDVGRGPIGAQVLVRRVGPGPVRFGYAARGPIATRFDAPSLAAFSAALRRVARRHRLSHVTIDPAMDDPAAVDLLHAAGWRPADLVQQHGTRLIDLRRTEEELWSDLRHTTRRYVNRARREGCTVAEGGRDDLPAFHGILVETAQRGGFIPRTLGSYEAIYDAFAEAGQARLLFARLTDGTPVAVKLLVACGGRVTQPYSGMTAAGGASRANYLLEWETIRRARAAGEDVYDMWGLASAGIAYFKAGFGGREVEYIGAWDLVTLPLLRDAIRYARRGYVWLARRRHGLRTGVRATGTPSGAPNGGAPSDGTRWRAGDEAP